MENLKKSVKALKYLCYLILIVMSYMNFVGPQGFSEILGFQGTLNQELRQELFVSYKLNLFVISVICLALEVIDNVLDFLNSKRI